MKMPISIQSPVKLAAELIMLSDKILITISIQEIFTSPEIIDLYIKIAKKMRLGYYFLIEQHPYEIQYFEPGKPVNFIAGRTNAVKYEYEHSKALNWIHQPGVLTIINLGATDFDSKISKITKNLKTPEININPEPTKTTSADSINIELPPLDSILKIMAVLRSNGWLSD